MRFGFPLLSLCWHSQGSNLVRDTELEGEPAFLCQGQYSGIRQHPQALLVPGSAHGTARAELAVLEHHTVPEAVTEHVHDLQERLDTQIPGEVIELEQGNTERLQMGTAPAAPHKLKPFLQGRARLCGHRTLPLAAAQKPLE